MSKLIKLICNLVQTNKTVREDVGNVGKLERFTFILTFYRKKADMTEESAEVCNEVMRAISLLTQNAPHQVNNAIAAGLLKAMEELRLVIGPEIMGPQSTALRRQVRALIRDFEEQVANYTPPEPPAPPAPPAPLEAAQTESKAPEGAPPPLQLALKPLTLWPGTNKYNSELARAYRTGRMFAETLKQEEAAEARYTAKAEAYCKTEAVAYCKTEAKTNVEETAESTKGLLKKTHRVEWTGSPGYAMEQTDAPTIDFEKAAKNGQKKYDEISAIVEKRLTVAPTKEPAPKRIQFGPDQVREITPRVKAGETSTSDLDEKTPMPSAYYETDGTPGASDDETKTPRAW